MPAITLTTITPFQMVGCGENNKTLLTQVVILLVKFIGKGHTANFVIFG